MFRSLRAKVVAGSVLIVMLVIAVWTWTLIHLDRISDQILLIEQQDFASLQTANRMRFALSQYNFAVLHYTANRTDSTRAAVVFQQEEFLHHLKMVQFKVRDSAEQRYLDTITANFHDLSVTVTQLAEIMSSDSAGVPFSAGEGMAFYFNRFLPRYEQTVVVLRDHRELFHLRLVEHVATIRSASLFISYSTMGIAIVVLVIGLIASRRLFRIVLHPLRQLAASVRRVTEGDFHHEIAIPSTSQEMDDLVEQFNLMVKRLRQHDAENVEQVVAEKRRAEIIVRDLSDVIIATDQESMVIYFNREAERVTGIPMRLAIGNHIGQLAINNALMQRILADITARRLDTAEEMFTLKSGGEERSYNYETRTIVNEVGEPIGYVFRLKDVTRFKQLDAIKTKMVSTVSHELRTPLTSIGMSLELLLEDDMKEGREPMQQELLENMREDVGRLQRFVNDLLDVSLIESGKARLALAPHAPRTLADKAAHGFLLITSPHRIHIDTTGVDAGLPPVLADADRVTQVFNNLYSNAIRYTPYGGTIRVTARKDEGNILFCVHDNGPGISEGDAAHIFEKFYQVRDDQRAGGSGLGLTIVKEIVEAHGGRVWVESAVGEGSSFAFTLPQAG